jgi:hypothetical protein
MLRYFPGFSGFYVRGQVYTDNIKQRKGQKMTSDYYLVTYIIDGREVVSAVHWRDLSKFRAENEIVSIVM